MPEDENSLDEQSENSASKDKKSKNIAIIIIAAVILIGLIIGFMMYTMSSSNDDSSMMNDNMQENMDKMPNTGNIINIGSIYPLEQFIVNLVSQGDRRYLKIAVNLELSDESLMAEVEAKTVVIRDVIISILSSKTLEDITTLEGKNKLKEEMLVRINSFMVDGNINNIFFTTFVVQ